MEAKRMQPEKIVLLCQRELTSAEDDLLQRFLRVFYWTSGSIGGRSVKTLIESYDVIVVPATDDAARVWWASELGTIPVNVGVVFLAKQRQEKCVLDEWGCHKMLKYLPETALNRDDLLKKLYSSHLKRILSFWGRVLLVVKKVVAWVGK